MANTITIKKSVLFLEGEIKNIKAKDGNEISYVSVMVLIRDDKCKVECSMKIKPEEFLELPLEPYQTYEATLQIDIADKVKIKILEIN